MKRFFILVLVCYATIACAFAQKGEKSIGLSLGYGSEIESLGIGARFQYGITDQIRLAPSFTYFLENNNLNLWDLDLNAHYLFPVNQKFTVYPIGGLIVSHLSSSSKNELESSVDYSDTKFGINLGGGAQYNFTESMSFFSEIKYGIVSDLDQLVILAGVAFKF